MPLIPMPKTMIMTMTTELIVTTVAIYLKYNNNEITFKTKTQTVSIII